MPRRKSHDQISAYHLDQIERQVGLLRIAMTEAEITLKPFRAHYEAIGQLRENLHTALNMLHDRPADYRPPHHGHFAP